MRAGHDERSSVLRSRKICTCAQYLFGQNDPKRSAATFQQTERRPDVICGSLCDETAIFRSVSEWKSSSWRQCFLSTIRHKLHRNVRRNCALCFGNASHSERVAIKRGKAKRAP